MKTKAAVAWKAGSPLTIETVDLQGPKFGEVLVEIKATGICHTDYYTLSGADPEGIFPAILGHEGAGIVVDVGPGVTTLKKGDHVKYYDKHKGVFGKEYESFWAKPVTTIKDIEKIGAQDMYRLENQPRELYIRAEIRKVPAPH